MTQTLMDSMIGVELQFPQNVDVDAFSEDFDIGTTSGLWLIKLESSPVHRWRGVDTKNNWIPVMIGVCDDWGYITIPTAHIPNMTEEELRIIYCDIAKRLGAVDVCFNGKSIMEASR